MKACELEALALAEVSVALEPATTHRLTLDVTGMVRDTTNLYAPDCDTALSFRGLAVDFTVAKGDSD